MHYPDVQLLSADQSVNLHQGSGLADTPWCNMQTALAKIRYAHSVARRCGWGPWQRLLQQAQHQDQQAQHWQQGKLLQQMFGWVHFSLLM